MTTSKNGQEAIHFRLHQAIAEMRKDLTRVEIWATALGTFAQPVPEYRPDEQYRLVKPAKTDPK